MNLYTFKLDISFVKPNQKLQVDISKTKYLKRLNLPNVTEILTEYLENALDTQYEINYFLCQKNELSEKEIIDFLKKELEEIITGCEKEIATKSN